MQFINGVLFHLFLTVFYCGLDKIHKDIFKEIMLFKWHM